ncbi:hypothetical protein [Rhizobium leguminosarum]|nr:hypothetical protein [Rhizobium leguminosarum]
MQVTERYFGLVRSDLRPDGMGHDHVCDLVEATPFFEATATQANRLHSGVLIRLRLAAETPLGGETLS